MRQETQSWDSLAVRLEAINAGVGVQNLTPIATLQRVSDGLWYDIGGGDFTAVGPTPCPLLPVPDLLGMYEFAPLAPSLQPPPASAGGYLFSVQEQTLLIYETGHITVTQDFSASAVWDFDIDTTVLAESAGSRLRNASDAVALGEGPTRDPLHISTAPAASPAGKFYTATIAPSAGATEAYAGRRAILWIATENRSYPCVINAVANDGADYFQLEREDAGAWDLDIALADRLIVATDLHQSFDASAVWSEATSAYAVPGTFGEGFRRMLALRQENMRVVYTAWNAVNVPTAGVVYIYPSKAAMDADAGGTGIGSFGSYVFDATFDGTPAIKPIEYTSGKTS